MGSSLDALNAGNRPAIKLNPTVIAHTRAKSDARYTGEIPG